MQRTRVGIIGTGITALSIGYYLPLVNPQVEIVYFDKAGKVGGRVATRRSRQNHQILFDHGAPYLYKDHLKGDFSKVLEKLGAIQQIKMNFAKAGELKQKIPQKTKTDSVYVGHDGFDSITSSIKKNLKNVDRYLFDCKVSQIRSNQKNQLSLVYQQNPKNPTWDQIAPFSRVFCCIPFPQARQLTQNLFSFQPFKNIKSSYHAKWMILVTVNKGTLFQAYKDTDVIDFSQCKNSPIKYAVKQNKKFKSIQNSEKQNWAIYFTEEWTEQNLKLSKEQVEELFVKEIVGNYLTEGSLNFKPQFLKAHRWLYSSPKNEKDQIICNALMSEDKRLVFAGDWVGSKQNIGECWQLGRQIVKQLYGLKQLETQISKSKL